MEYQLIPMEEKHLLTLAALERICFSDPWSENAFRAELDNPGARFTVAQDGAGTVLGYLGLPYVLDEGYIANIAVDPLFRRQSSSDTESWSSPAGCRPIPGCGKKWRMHAKGGVTPCISRLCPYVGTTLP